MDAFSDDGGNRVQVYRTSRSSRIVLAVLLPPLILLSLALMSLPYWMDRSEDTGLAVICMVLGGSCALLLLGCLVSNFRTRVGILPDRIVKTGLFGSSEFPLSQAKGFRLVANRYGKSLVLEPKMVGVKNFRIVLNVERQPELIAWFNRSFTNLDAVDYREEVNRVLQDERLGSTPEQRLELLDAAKKWTKILIGVTAVPALWAFFWPEPYRYVMWTLIGLPWIVLVCAFRFSDVLKFGTKKQSAYPDISLAFAIPCVMLTVRAFMDFHILEWDNFWQHFGGVSAILAIVALAIVKDTRKSIGKALVLVLFCAAYGYGAVLSVNALLDGSTPSLYKARVLDMRISHGRHTSYHLKLSPWGPKTAPEEIDVGKSTYQRHKKGDEAMVVLNKGMLGIPWFIVR